MNDPSLRPGLWINYTNSQVIILVLDYKSFSEQLTLLSDPSWLVRYVTKSMYAHTNNGHRAMTKACCLLPS